MASYRGLEFDISTKRSKASDEWLVFLHGLGCAKESFDGVFSTSLVQDYSILTLDFPGFGASSKPYNFDYKLEKQAAVIKGVIEGMPAKKVHLVAHSMGGAVASLMELSNLASFTNAEGNLIGKDCGIVSRDTVKDGEEYFVQHGRNEFLSTLENSEDSAMHEWAEWYRKAGRVALYRSADSLVEWSDSGKLLERFNSLNVSKAFIYGQDSGCEPNLYQLQNTEVIQVANSGHFMMQDNPADFYGAISGFLNRVS